MSAELVDTNIVSTGAETSVASSSAASTAKGLLTPRNGIIAAVIILILIIVIVLIVKFRSGSTSTSGSAANTSGSTTGTTSSATGGTGSVSATTGGGVTALPAKKPFAVDDNNRNLLVQVCGSCPGPAEGAGSGAGNFSVVLDNGVYTGEELAVQLNNKLNAVYGQATNFANDWQVKFVNNKFTVQSLGKRAWWLADTNANAYNLLGLTGAMQVNAGNWIWSGGVFVGTAVGVERFVTMRDLSLKYPSY